MSKQQLWGMLAVVPTFPSFSLLCCWSSASPTIPKLAVSLKLAISGLWEHAKLEFLTRKWTWIAIIIWCLLWIQKLLIQTARFSLLPSLMPSEFPLWIVGDAKLWQCKAKQERGAGDEWACWNLYSLMEIQRWQDILPDVAWICGRLFLCLMITERETCVVSWWDQTFIDIWKADKMRVLILNWSTLRFVVRTLLLFLNVTL